VAVVRPGAVVALVVTVVVAVVAARAAGGGSAAVVAVAARAAGAARGGLAGARVAASACRCPAAPVGEGALRGAEQEQRSGENRGDESLAHRAHPFWSRGGRPVRVTGSLRTTRPKRSAANRNVRASSGS